MLTCKTEFSVEFVGRQRDDEGFQLRTRWAMMAMNSVARVCLIAENEVGLIVRQYLELIDDIEKATSKVEEEHLDLLRGHAVARVDKLLRTGSIDREMDDSLCLDISGEPFESASDESALVAEEVSLI